MKSLTKYLLAVCISLCGLFWWLHQSLPAILIFSSNDFTLTQTIVDHKLPKLHRAYLHSGKPELVVTKPWTDDITNSFANVYWCKVIDKAGESQKSFWKKFGDRIVAMLRFMAFDEKGALLVTERKYTKDDEITSGEYVYLGILRATIHLEGYGTGVWEFPAYADKSMSFEHLNTILKLSESDIIESVRHTMYSTVPPEQSYKVQLVDRGAIRRESWQPWIDVSCDVTVEYIGDGINSKYSIGSSHSSSK